MRNSQQVFACKISTLTKSGTSIIYNFSSAPLTERVSVTETISYIPCITQVPTIDSQVGLFIWGNKSQSSVSDMRVSTIPVPNLLSDNRVRDGIMEFFIFYKGSTGALVKKQIFKGVITNIKKTKREFSISVKSNMDLVDQPASTKNFSSLTKNSALEGNVVPFVIGRALSCPLVTVSNHTDDFIGCDKDIIEYERVYDNGDVLGLLDWEERQNNDVNAPMVHLNSPDFGVITADINGPRGEYDDFFHRDVNYSRNISNINWYNSAPDGWTIERTPGTGNQLIPAGNRYAVFFTNNQTGGVPLALRYTKNNQELKQGRHYRVEVSHRGWGNANVSPGVKGIELYVGSTKVGELPAPTNQYVTHTFEFRAPETAQFKFQAPDYTQYPIVQGIGQCKITRLAESSNLTNFIYELMVNRGGLNSSDINWGSFQSVQNENYFSIGTYHQSSVNIQTILDEVNKTYNTWIIDRGDGLMSMGELKDPSSMVIDFEINSKNQAGYADCYVDTAPGLSNSISCRKNHYVFDRDRIADQVSVRKKERITRSYRRTYQFDASPSSLHPNYSHANQAPPIGTLIQDSTHAQQRIQKTCSLYTIERQFVDVPVNLNTGEAYDLQFGDCISFEDNKFILVGRKYKIETNTILLKLWR